MRTGSCLLALVLAGIVGCSDSRSLRVGAKPFAEQRILARMTGLILREAGWPVEPVVECDDTYSCMRALREGRIDLMVDYTGTGLVFLGEPVPEVQEEALRRVRESYGPAGVNWLTPLGFDNGYRVVIRTDRAAAGGIRSIEDLIVLGDGLKIACSAEYLRRPLDGLDSLLGRHGIRSPSNPLVLNDGCKRVEALLDRQVDVAVVFATDGVLTDSRLTVLEDTLRFFPPYEAVLVVHGKTLERHPGLTAVLARLEGRFPVEAMRKLNHAVQWEGRTPAAVAAEFLRNEKLLAGPDSAAKRVPELTIAVHRADALDSFAVSAQRAARSAFPTRPVVVKQTDDPIREVCEGKARLALLGAERFFQNQGKERTLRDERVEAVAVLGARVLHLVIRAGGNADGPPGRVGIQPTQSGAGRVGEILLDAAGIKPAMRGTAEELLAAVSGGALEQALILAEEGDPALVRAMKQGGLRLSSPELLLVAAGREPVPYLRRTRIPRQVYAGQASAVDTAGDQVVLAAPKPDPRGLGDTGGPATALRSSGLPLSPGETEVLAKAAGGGATPDPVLPSAWSAAAPGRTVETVGGSVAATVLSSLVIVFLIWLACLVVRRPDVEGPP